MKEITLGFRLEDSEYYTALRLVCGAVCNAYEMNVDDIEDFKVCVTESALILKNCGFDKVLCTFKTDRGITFTVCGEGGAPKEGDNELSLALISALVDGLDIGKKGNIIERVTLKIC